METYDRFSKMPLDEVAKELDGKKFYNSWDEAESGFVSSLINSNNESTQSTVIEITKTITDYSVLYGFLIGCGLLTSIYFVVHYFFMK